MACWYCSEVESWMVVGSAEWAYLGMENSVVAGLVVAVGKSHEKSDFLGLDGTRGLCSGIVVGVRTCAESSSNGNSSGEGIPVSQYISWEAGED